MTITNINLVAITKTLAKATAALSMLGAMSNATLAFTDSERAACPAPACEILPAVHVAQSHLGALTLTDEKGRRWTVARPEIKPASEIDFPRDWSDGKSVGEAYERYLAALDQTHGPLVRVSHDGRYHLCVASGTVTCIYVPAR
jgi:hypothetical protein